MTTSTNGTFDRTPLIAGNWKMNMDHVQGITLLQKLAWTLSDARHDFSRVEVSVFPPFTDIRGVQTLVQGDKLKLSYGAQDLSDKDSGAYTGDISGAFLNKLGCSYVLVGHSERREIHGESDELLNAKVKAAFRHGLTPVLCAGEGLQIRQAGTHVEHTLAQVRAAVPMAPNEARSLVLDLVGVRKSPRPPRLLVASYLQTGPLGRVGPPRPPTSDLQTGPLGRVGPHRPVIGPPATGGGAPRQPLGWWGAKENRRGGTPAQPGHSPAGNPTRAQPEVHPRERPRLRRPRRHRR
jgi:hypothetical protein